MIRQVNSGDVVEWGPGKMPLGFALRCGSCGSREVLRIGKWTQHGEIQVSSTICPACKRHVYFVAVSCIDSAKAFGGGKVFFTPAAEEWVASDVLLEALPVGDELHTDYLIGIQYFNARDPRGIVACARRVLEGLVDKYIPKAEQSFKLSKNLPKLEQSHDLSGALRGMAEAVNAAGNLGVHFGSSRTSDAIASKSGRW